MDHLNREALRLLAQTQGNPCVSVYMPTYHVEAELSQNTIRLKNLIREARQALKTAGYHETLIGPMLLPAIKLIDRADAWSDSSDGMAIFLTPSVTHMYRVPLAVEELVVTGRRFHLKPLFPLLASNNRFYVLTLSKHHVGLYQGSHHALKEVHASAIPEGIVDEFFGEKSEREHTGNRVGGGPVTLYHGAGAQDEKHSARLREGMKRALREIDRGLRTVLREESAPLLLAGIEAYLPLYRDVNTYGHLIEDVILAGSPDHLSGRALHAKSWDVVEPLFNQAQANAIDHYQELLNRDGMASSDVKEIIPAAVFRRVDTLFVPIGQHLWGQYDAATNSVMIHEEQQASDEDLYDFAAVQTYLNGGTVHAMRPENMPAVGLAATFRYPAHVEAVER